MPSKIKQHGLNLIELMVVLVVVGIIAGVGGPALTSTIERNNIRAETNRLIASLNFARSQAVTKQQVVTLERKSATSKDWSEGWTIFSDFDSNGGESIETSEGDQLLKDFTSTPSGISINADTNATQYISFQPSGRSSNAVTISICNKDLTDAISGSQIQISIAGRVSTSTIAAADKAANCTP
jgi:type IV fimbrial biogenesis protein FimT